MSARQALQHREASRPKQTARPKLRLLVRPNRRMGTVPFAVLALILLVGGLVGLLALTTFVQNQAFELRGLQRRATELSYRVSDLESQVSKANAPAQVAARAAELGMVPNTSAAYIDLVSGKILGEPRPAQFGEVPGLRVSPSSLLLVPGEQKVKSTILPWLDFDVSPKTEVKDGKPAKP